MPAHKRQHYVPKCYLRPFSSSERQAAINLYNIDRSTSISNASLKNQCAKNYFYGEDLAVERRLQKIEKEYARIINIINNQAESITESDMSFLRGFAYLQYICTDMAAKRMRYFQQDLAGEVGGEYGSILDSLDVSDQSLMHDSIRLFSETYHIVEDLKVCILRNETPLEFVTSDDPAVLTNRFYLQRIRANSFGLTSSGDVFILPLTPDHALLCYDGSVYVIPGRRRVCVEINNEQDIFSINELQYMKAAENIYFKSWDLRNRVEREFEECQDRRPESWHEIHAFVPISENRDSITYRRASEQERQTEARLMLNSRSCHRAPSTWLSKLKFRVSPRTYFNGTGVGHVRKREWLRAEGL